MRKKHLWPLFASAFVFAAVLGMQDTPVLAAESQLNFGSEDYQVESGETFQVGVYIDCDEDPSTYQAILIYDADRLEYVSGADVATEGTIQLSGTACDSQIKYMLTFRAISGGNAGIYASSLLVNADDGSGTMDVIVYGQAEITISGEDNTGAPDFEFADPTEDTSDVPELDELESDIPILGYALGEDGNQYRVVDLSQMIPEVCDWKYQTKQITVGGVNMTVLTDTQEILSVIYLVDENENYYMYCYGHDGELYPCRESDDFYYMAVYASIAWPSSLTEEQAINDNIFVTLNKDGEIAFRKLDAEGYPVAWNASEEEATTEAVDTVDETTQLLGKRGLLVQYSGFIILGVLILFWIISRILGGKKKSKKRKQMAKKYVEQLPEEDDWRSIRKTEEAHEAEEAAEEAAKTENEWVDKTLEENYRLAQEIEQKQADAVEAAKEMDILELQSVDPKPVAKKTKKTAPAPAAKPVEKAAPAPAQKPAAKASPAPVAEPVAKAASAPAQESRLVGDTLISEAPVIRRARIRRARPAAASAAPVQEGKPAAEEIVRKSSRPEVLTQNAETTTAAGKNDAVSGNTVDLSNVADQLEEIFKQMED